MDQAILLKATEKQKEKSKRNVINWIQNKDGSIKASSPTNVMLFIQSQSCFDGAFRLNEFTGLIEVTKSIQKNGMQIKKEMLEDSASVEIRMYAERVMNITFTKDAIDDGIQKIARDHSYNPILDYMNEAYDEWDKHSRLQHVFHDFLGVEETETTDLITRLFFVGGVAKVYNHETKFDFCLDLVGSQGTGKTVFLQRIAPLGYYTDQFTNFSDKDDIARMARNFIVNDDEMTATDKCSFEELKKFISLTEFTFRPPYGRNDIYKDKGFVMARTTNNLYYLKDKTGDRRFLPVRCHRKHSKNVFDDLTDEYVKQLWGEAVNLYKSKTVDISAHSKEENELLNKQREQFKYTDFFDDAVSDVVENYLTDKNFISNEELYKKTTGKAFYDSRDKKVTNKISDVMVNVYGWRKSRKTINGKQFRGFTRQ